MHSQSTGTLTTRIRSRAGRRAASGSLLGNAPLGERYASRRRPIPEALPASLHTVLGHIGGRLEDAIEELDRVVFEAPELNAAGRGDVHEALGLLFGALQVLATAQARLEGNGASVVACAGRPLPV
jgi:hypothetical protein